MTSDAFVIILTHVLIFMTGCSTIMTWTLAKLRNDGRFMFLGGAMNAIGWSAAGILLNIQFFS